MENSQQLAMRIQVLLSMGQDRVSKEETTELLGQRVHVLTSTQDLRHLTRNFVNLAGDYLGEGILSVSQWRRGSVTLTASSGNMTRPSQGTLSLEQT